jgi:hypothetical protein
MSNFTGVALDYDQLSSASLGTYPSLVCWVRANEVRMGRIHDSTCARIRVRRTSVSAYLPAYAGWDVACAVRLQYTEDGASVQPSERRERWERWWIRSRVPCSRTRGGQRQRRRHCVRSCWKGRQGWDWRTGIRRVSDCAGDLWIRRTRERGRTRGRERWDGSGSISILGASQVRQGYGSTGSDGR